MTLELFKKNIRTGYEASGESWLKALPTIIKQLQLHWNLHECIPIENMTYHYVSKAITQDGIPVVLKIGYDRKLLENEAKCLRIFNGERAVELLDVELTHNALLLRQAIPGTTLKSLYPKQRDFVIDRYAEVVKTRANSQEFDSIKSWLNSIDIATSDQLPKALLSKAIALKNQLLSTMGTPHLLHGDLHLDNIIENEGEWLCIDPKGILGEIEFEISACDINELSEIKHLASAAKVSHKRLTNWIFVRRMLSACWALEDNDDPIEIVPNLVETYMAPHFFRPPFSDVPDVHLSYPSHLLLTSIL